LTILSRLTRRGFLEGVGGGLTLANLTAATSAGELRDSRLESALDLRRRAALAQSRRKIASMKSNGDEKRYPDGSGCFTKGLPKGTHNEVDPKAYNALLRAIQTRSFSEFEKIPRAGGRRLSNPQSAFAFHMEGGDPHSFDIPAPPSMASQQMETDVSELYWQALCRDIPFTAYSSSEITLRAAKGLKKTPESLFRGSFSGSLKGPYISQFLLKSIPFGATQVEQRYTVPAEGSDFMTTVSEWSQIQSGFPPWRTVEYDRVPRYLTTGRDLAEYAHYDFAHQAYLSAALILINSSYRSLLNCNQYKSDNNPYRLSTVEEGFGTFGPAEAVDWIGRVVTPALKAAYCQKWMVHRRIRPEELGGLIHFTRTKAKACPLHPSLLESNAVDAVFASTGCYLLPQAFPEGCPMHPSYPAGHATIAGACSVILKACFDGTMLLSGSVEVAPDRLSLRECQGYSPTVGDEIDKLAFNVAMARNWAGIHYLSDDMAGLRLGEDVGLSVLQDLAQTFSEEFKGFFITRFDGSKVYVTPRGELVPA